MNPRAAPPAAPISTSSVKLELTVSAVPDDAVLFRPMTMATPDESDSVPVDPVAIDDTFDVFDPSTLVLSRTGSVIPDHSMTTPK